MIRFPRPLGTMGFLAAWLIPWRPAFLTNAEPSKLKFFAHWRDVLGRHVAKYGSHEPELTAWIAQHLQNSPPGIVIDVGANIGWHAVHAAQFDTVTAVIAFEADAFNAWLLDRNLTINNIDKVIVKTCAVGAAPGTARLHRYKGSNRGRHSVVTEYGSGSRVVPMTDLDSALEQLGLCGQRVTLLKIDVEGYEPQVIAGAARTLDRTDVVVAEYSPVLSQSGAWSAFSAARQLCAAGFVPHTLEATGIARMTIGDLQLVTGQTDVIWISEIGLAR